MLAMIKENKQRTCVHSSHSTPSHKTSEINYFYIDEDGRVTRDYWDGSFSMQLRLGKVRLSNTEQKWSESEWESIVHRKKAAHAEFVSKWNEFVAPIKDSFHAESAVRSAKSCVEYPCCQWTNYNLLLSKLNMFLPCLEASPSENVLIVANELSMAVQLAHRTTDGNYFCIQSFPALTCAQPNK